MSFRLSSGTLDTMAGVFAPPKRYRLGSAGGKGKGERSGGTVLGIALASALTKPNATSSGPRSGAQIKHAFGGGGQGAASRRAIATMDRTARRVPEVMVRITGRQHGGGHVLANFIYISRLGHGGEKEVPLHTSDGDVLRDGKDMQILAQDWQEWENGDDARRQGSTSISMILSMPAGTDAERLKFAALEFAREEMANRSWVAALHQDRDHPHVHLTIARRDHDGRRFHPSRDDLFRYRQRFAEKLREQGIEANATPARARGVDPLHEPIAAHKVRQKGQVPRVDAGRQARTQRLQEAGIADPVERVMRQRQDAVRKAYELSIAELSTSPDPQDQEVARSLATFAASLPVPEANSLRAPREQREREPDGDNDGPFEALGDSTVAALDPVASALAKLRMSSAAARQTADGFGAISGEPGDRTAPSRLSETLRNLIDQSGDTEQARQRNMDEIGRQAEERERARRERDRDRSRDKDGPER